MYRLAFFFLLLALSTAAAGLDGANILRRIDESMWPDSYEMYRKLVNVERSGSEREYLMYTLKKGRTKVVNLFLKPPEEHGRVILRVRENMWLRIPDVEQALRVSSMHSVVGGVFNNWDLMFSDFASDYEVLSAEQEGDLYALTLKRKSRWAIYQTLRIWVGKGDWLLRKVEAYTDSDMLVKSMTFRNIRDFGDGILRPSVMETESPLWPGVKAIMFFLEIRKRDLSDEVFTVNYMSKIDDMRR